MHIKRFFEWIGLKEKLHQKVSKPPFVNEGDIWWASLGENIGAEINGKSDLFSRPVIILKKLSHSFYLVIPTTTQYKNGSWYVAFKQNNRIYTACLHQARSIDHKRLWSKLWQLDEQDFKNIHQSFINLYK